MTDSIEELIADLESPDRLVRTQAVWALKRLGIKAKRAIPALKQLFNDQTEPFIRLCAAGVVSTIQPDDTDVLQILIEGLAHPIDPNRMAAVEFLGERGNKIDVLNVMPLLQDEDFTFRFASGEALGKCLGDWSHAISICVQMMTDENETNRAIAAECLLSVRRHVKDLEPLIQVLRGANWEARLDVEELLWAMKASNDPS